METNFDCDSSMSQDQKKPEPLTQQLLSQKASVALPNAGSAETATRLSQQRQRDTKPELLLRRELHRRGLRYRVDAQLPEMPRRRADLLFTRRKVAVFVDGCFWHACPLHATNPRSNSEWWSNKLQNNVKRDLDTNARLSEQGWVVLRFWEHEDIITAADIIEQHVRGMEPKR